MQKIVSPRRTAHGERNLEVCDSSDDGVNSGREDKEYSGGDTDTQGKEPYQLIPTGHRSDDFATLHPAPTSAQDGLDPLQLALVLIFS